MTIGPSSTSVALPVRRPVTSQVMSLSTRWGLFPLTWQSRISTRYENTSLTQSLTFVHITRMAAEWNFFTSLPVVQHQTYSRGSWQGRVFCGTCSHHGTRQCRATGQTATTTGFRGKTANDFAGNKDTIQKSLFLKEYLVFKWLQLVKILILDFVIWPTKHW